MDEKQNFKSTSNEDKNDNESNNFVKDKLSIFQNEIKHRIQIENKIIKIISLIIILLFFLTILIYFSFLRNPKQQKELLSLFEKKNLSFIHLKENEKKENYYEIKKNEIFNSTHSNKWIVLTTIHDPNYNLEKLLNLDDPWKIVVIGDVRTNNASWEKFKTSEKLVYLSLEDQNNLSYNITKYIPLNSYSRKNIGYLYAIQHGAKEIYELDDDIMIFNKYYLNYTEEYYSYYAENNDTLMINPYSYYGKPSIWPRGYRLKDIEKNCDTKFYRLINRRTELNHLIFQGLLNINPDVDSIFLKTRSIKNIPMNEFFYIYSDLMYLPGNFVPINSKNTRFLYDVFPSLALPTTVSMKVCDIWRGYIMQRYAWIYNGTVLFRTPYADHKRNYHNDKLDFINEKDLYFKLDNLLDALNIDVDSNIKNPSEFLIKMIEILVNKEILGKNDLDMYKAFIEDLNSFGYSYNLKFNTKIERDDKKFLNIYSDLKFYFPRKNKMMIQNNNRKGFKLFKHKYSKTKYDDILLIINYNFKFLVKLQSYMLKLYHENFPNIVFVYPGDLEDNKTYVACPESHKGYFFYKCVKRVYERFPNKKGYLFLMDDDFLKVWELENFDFNIPWLYHFFIRNDEFDEHCFISGKRVLDSHPDWKKIYRKFLGSDIIAYAVSDIFYLPQEDIVKFSSMVDEFYKHRVFLETAIPTMIGLLLKPKYQIIMFIGLWREKRGKVIEYLKEAEIQLTIHPIKFSNFTLQEVVNKYIFIMNARDY